LTKLIIVFHSLASKPELLVLFSTSQQLLASRSVCACSYYGAGLSPKGHHAAIVQLSYGTPVVSSFLWGTPLPKGGLILGKCVEGAKFPRKNCPGGQNFLPQRNAFYKRKAQECLLFAFFMSITVLSMHWSAVRVVWAKERSTYWWERIVNSTFTPNDWLENFRLSHNTFVYLCNELRQAIEKENTITS